MAIVPQENNVFLYNDAKIVSRVPESFLTDNIHGSETCFVVYQRAPHPTSIDMTQQLCLNSIKIHPIRQCACTHCTFLRGDNEWCNKCGPTGTCSHCKPIINNGDVDTSRRLLGEVCLTSPTRLTPANHFSTTEDAVLKKAVVAMDEEDDALVQASNPSSPSPESSTSANTRTKSLATSFLWTEYLPKISGAQRLTEEPILRLCTFNVRSLRNLFKKGGLTQFLRDKYDIVVFTELQADLVKLNKIPALCQAIHEEYPYGAWHPCKNDPGYSGVAMFSQRRPAQVIPGFLLPGMQPPGKDIEGRVLTMVFLDIVVVGIYTPASS